jgi:glycosyltransferase involved in cell wall biosynthesis
MKILHLAPLWFPVAQDSLGGVETFLTHLIRALEDLGCSTTLIASGDSQTAAELVPVVPLNLCAQMEAGSAAEYVYYEQHQLLLALKLAAEYNVVHSHVGWGGYVLSAALSGQPVLHTQHNPVYRDQEWFVSAHPDLWYSTVSQFQARQFVQQGASRCHVIHNGIDVSEFTFRSQSGDGLLFIGRMEDEKGPDLAVQVARALDRPLTLAGPIIDEEFFDRAVKPFLNGQIQYVGVVDHTQKTTLFGQAACVLMPSRVNEGCPIVSFEAMACGTPVVALANGALPEIVEAGLTGFVTHEEAMLPMLVTQAVSLDRSAIRARVAARFDISVVAAKYCELYQYIAVTPNAARGAASR